MSDKKDHSRDDPASKGSARKVVHLLRDLQHNREAQRQVVASTAMVPGLERLRRWQSERLAATYADLLDEPQYRSACTFFLNDIYAAKDFSQRDDDAENLHGLLSRFLPESMLRLLADTIRLNRMSTRLDLELLSALGEVETITPQAYAQAYRVCDNLAERREQIELLAQVLGEAAHGARGTVFAVSLRLARLPAQRAGWDDLYDFLARGYAACKPMRDVGRFVDTIYRREMAILENIFSATEDPFTVR